MHYKANKPLLYTKTGGHAALWSHAHIALHVRCNLDPCMSYVAYTQHDLALTCNNIKISQCYTMIANYAIPRNGCKKKSATCLRLPVFADVSVNTCSRSAHRHRIAPQRNAAILFAFKGIQTRIDRATRCGLLINRPAE